MGQVIKAEAIFRKLQKKSNEVKETEISEFMKRLADARDREEEKSIQGYVPMMASSKEEYSKE